MENNFFNSFIEGLLERHADKGSSKEQVTLAVKTALSVEGLLNNLAEVFRTSKTEIEKDLEALDMSAALDQYRLSNLSAGSNAEDDTIVLSEGLKDEFPELFRFYSKPVTGVATPISSGLKKTLEGIFKNTPSVIANDPFVGLYRSGALDYYSEKSPRGEYVLVVEGASDTNNDDGVFWQDMTVTEHVDQYINDGMTQKDAIKATAVDRNVPKRDIYAQYHEIGD